MGYLGGVDTKNLELPIVDLSGLDITRLDEKVWVKARSKIAEALEIYGGFEVVYNEVSSELRNDLLGLIVPTMFTMPVVNELSDAQQVPYHGIWFQKQGFPYSALQLEDPNSLVAVQEYANIIWPQENDFFCNTVLNYAKHMQEIINMIHRMIIESLCLELHQNDSHMKSLACSIRFSNYYKNALDDGINLSLPSHKDPNYISIICPHNVEGLEIETRGGEWIQAKPMKNSFTVLVGEVFKAWTNGRLHAPNHRVKLKNETEKRYAVIFSTIPSLTNDMINAPEELIDEQHPLLFKPFKYYDYVKFRFSEEGEKTNDALKAYCGV
ncbi:probable 2-oxoglutarate-dependent dioxygenase AOP1 [Dendrobium catenatum]|uniref:Gibberellin 3-beta-dioxygenase 4 n=1 Tax=Dendrobium catenatum TaxID=906689 RepID=A0A2I0WGR3_9ASPA|nr:probable 2-oxoglutarate-dependent dioxygenase AOP1 [Dendrobium catenatum]PKU74832.1 Gibberellin 3-beta-dioxygenase 4 [Dendrobium catenatum]